jgi:hypothetical protein
MFSAAHSSRMPPPSRRISSEGNRSVNENTGWGSRINAAREKEGLAWWWACFRLRAVSGAGFVSNGARNRSRRFVCGDCFVVLGGLRCANRRYLSHWEVKWGSSV